MLDTLVARARSAGYSRVRLDSHRASMGTAINLYRSRGFVEIPPYGPDLDGALVYGEELGPALVAAPRSALIAVGSPIRVAHAVRIA